jgi:uncharacterized protein (TIGR00730 family)
MKSVAVFCGSGNGAEPIYCDHARMLGIALARKDIRLVYGGAKIGVMGAVADGTLHGGGMVTGVIPDFLTTKEVAHDHLTELIVVSSMHERKMKMHELCDGIIALPGGFGTLEEFFETLTWSQLGLHQKPIALLNTGGYFDPLLVFIDSMLETGFITTVHRSMITVSEDVEELLHEMSVYQPPVVKKWLRRGEV